VLVLLMRGIFNCEVEMDAGGMIYKSSFMTIDWGIQVILRLSPQEFERLQFRYY
jgi:hypothetical protein